MTTCSAAPKIAYGSIQTSTSTFVNYTCDTGYSMQGNPFIECSNGVWNMTNYPICLVSLEPYSNSGMDYHADSNTTRDTAPEWSTWFVYGVMGSGGCLALAIVVFCLLACCHICGCCAGPMVAVGGRYQYSDRRWYSVFTWCDFMLKGKVCRKIRKMNRSKTVSPPLETVTIEDETAKTGEETDNPETENDAKPPDNQDSEKQTDNVDNDVSSSTSGYASSSPSCSPLPEEEPLLPDTMATEISPTNDKNEQSSAKSDDEKLSDIEENISETASDGPSVGVEDEDIDKETPDNKKMTTDSSNVDAVANAVPSNQATVKQSPSNQAVAKQVPSNQAQAKQSPSNQSPAKPTPSSKASSNRAPSKQAPSNKSSAKQVPAASGGAVVINIEEEDSKTLDKKSVATVKTKPTRKNKNVKSK